MRKSKNRYFYHIFVSPPGGRPCGNNVKCDMDGKRIGTDGHRGDCLLMYTHVAHVVSATATRMGDGCDMIISYSVHNKYSIAVADERQWGTAAAAAARTSIGPMQQRAILCRCGW